MYEIHYPSSFSSKNASHCLVFFISGNPGLIDYYEPFLSTLRTLLDVSKEDTPVSFHLLGKNLSGFDDGEHEPFSAASPPHGLEAQILHTASYLSSLRLPETASEDGGSREYDHMILMGHSVGSYIALEIFHRQHLNTNQIFSSLPLHSAILLFPTVTHIAKSPSGKRLVALNSIPLMATHAHTIARSLISCIPDSVLSTVLRWVMRMPQHGADVTKRFLRSRDGIWQALHMGKDEMEKITEERWAEDMWGRHGDGGEEEPMHGERIPKFLFYFARSDHWVDDGCRDEFIARRKSQTNGRTRVEICDWEIPHAFCISKFVDLF